MLSEQRSLFNERTFFHELAERAGNATKDSLHEGCLNFLRAKSLTVDGRSYYVDRPVDARSCVFSASCERSATRRNEDPAAKRQLPKPSIDKDALWYERTNPDQAIALLDIDRLPADAMAFYHPMHLTPQYEWGIYLWADKLLAYADYLTRAMAGRVVSFGTSDIVLSFVVFEVFHHEFFHHIVECAAITLEVASAAFGTVQPLYREYRHNMFEKQPDLGRHRHHPLEEALANAYAYNSLSFIARMKPGYRTTLAKIYQKALIKYWPREPPGYCFAEAYIGPGHPGGAAQLLAMILACGRLDPVASLVVSRQVLLNGHSAFFAKPDVPTRLIGSKSAVEAIKERLPNLNDTYSQLALPIDSTDLDTYIAARIEAEKEKKQASKNA